MGKGRDEGAVDERVGDRREGKVDDNEGRGCGVSEVGFGTGTGSESERVHRQRKGRESSLTDW